LGRYCICIF